MHIEPFEYDNIDEEIYFYIDVRDYDPNFPDDIEIEIQERWKDENCKWCIEIKPCSFPWYRKKELYEYAIDHVQKLIYEDQRGM